MSLLPEQPDLDDLRQLRVGAIGAGRVGAVLAAGFRAAGLDVAVVAGRSDATRTRVETLLPGVSLADPDAVARTADLLLLTVPDDTLAGLVAGLVARGTIRPGQLVVHTSGRHGLDVLAPAEEVGAVPVAMHPAMTFTGTHLDLARLPGCSFGLTTREADRDLGEALVTALGGLVTWVPESRRILYHASLAHSANHLVALVSESMGMLKQAGVQDPAATLRPLLQAALDNALDFGDAALTGPVVRGDVSTVEAHARALRDVPGPALDSYLAMARATVEHAVADGRLSRRRARAITEVLDAAVWDATAAAMADPTVP